MIVGDRLKKTIITQKCCLGYNTHSPTNIYLEMQITNMQSLGHIFLLILECYPNIIYLLIKKKKLSDFFMA